MPSKNYPDNPPKRRLFFGFVLAGCGVFLATTFFAYLYCLSELTRPVQADPPYISKVYSTNSVVEQVESVEIKSAYVVKLSDGKTVTLNKKDVTLNPVDTNEEQQLVTTIYYKQAYVPDVVECLWVQISGERPILKTRSSTTHYNLYLKID